MSTSKVYQQYWKEWAGWCAQLGLPNNAISAPKLANFLLHLFQVGLTWCWCCCMHATLHMEQLISYLWVALFNTLSSLPKAEGGVIPVSKVCELLLRIHDILDKAVSK